MKGFHARTRRRGRTPAATRPTSASASTATCSEPKLGFVHRATAVRDRSKRFTEHGIDSAEIDPEIGGAGIAESAVLQQTLRLPWREAVGELLGKSVRITGDFECLHREYGGRGVVRSEEHTSE